MATMSLRLGAKHGGTQQIPGSERKKINTLVLHSKFIERAKRLEDDRGDGLFNDVQLFTSAISVEEQLLILKSMTKKYFEKREHVNEMFMDYFITLLVEIYVLADLKNPLKWATARILSQFAPPVDSFAQKHLMFRLKTLMADVKESKENAQLNFAANSLAGCFNNFPLGAQAVTSCINSVLDFLKECLEAYIAALGSELSPARKMEVYQYIHNASRAAVTILQKCQMNVNTVAADLEAVLTIGDHPSPEHQVLNKDTLTKLFKPAAFCIAYQDLPMDTKSNCGLMLVTLAILLERDEGWLNLLHQGTGNSYAEPCIYLSLDLTSDVSCLCLCGGLINALPMDVLNSSTPNSDSTVIDQLFHQFLNIGKRSTSESSMILAVSRFLQQLTRCLCNAVQHAIGKPVPPGSPSISILDHVSAGNGKEALGSAHIQQDKSAISIDALSSIVTAILDDALQFVWTHLEHYMDSVRHAAKGMLHNLVVLGVHLQNTESEGREILKTITEAVLSIPEYRKCRYIALSTLASETSCQALLTEIPDLVDRLLTSLKDPGLVTHVASAFETLMLKHQEECSEEEWKNIWLFPLLTALDHSSSDTCIGLEEILAKAVRRCPSAVDGVLPTAELGVPCDRLLTVLTCLKISRRHGTLAVRDHIGSKWRGFLEYRILEESLCHVQDEIRLSALAILTECHRSTEPFMASELHLIRTFLEHNINTQVPAARQQALALLKKILVRMKDSSAALKRKQPKTCNDLLRSYGTFCMWLVEFGFKNLFPGANFGRRSSALQLLTLFVEIFGRDETSSMWTRGNADTLMECLKDTYENNKLLTLKLLLNFPESALRFDDPAYLSPLITACLQLASSNRPPDCITAAYLLRCLVGFPQCKPIQMYVHEQLLARSISFCETGISYEKDLVYRVLTLLECQLRSELEVADKSLLSAAGSAPMYGTVFCIRQLIQDVDLGTVSISVGWRDLISRLVDLCCALIETVTPVVNNSSPEGHLPMDFQPGASQIQDLDFSGTEFEEKVRLGGAPNVLHVTAQMVLLCSWRTVKEVSLFLGEISERTPIATSFLDTKGLITEQQLLWIGEHFTTLLAETKHRGAFEQAYIGFCKLSTRLWRLPEGKLHQLPAKWLEELLVAIETGSGTKLCSTRRSAGVPFMVQALVATELQVGGSLECFQKSMSKLLEMASGGKKLESRTHSLNILRALYRHTQLGELVTPFVADGVIAAIRGFKGSTWAERNSATLLFSALMTRIFGVARSREKLSIRNRMTGRIFFHRYPKLFDFLLEELRESTASLTSDAASMTLQPSLFPVLLVLARLYPSSLDGTDSSLQLSEYIQYVEECARCSVMKTRIVAARAVVPLITPNLYSDHLDRLFGIASSENDIGQNFRHGILLQITHLLQGLTGMLDVIEGLKERIPTWVNQSKWLLCPTKRTCYVTSETYLQVLQQLITTCFTTVPSNVWLEIKLYVEQDLFTSKKPCVANHGMGKDIYELRAGQVFINLCLCLAGSRLPGEMEDTVLRLLNHSSYEVILVALNFLHGLFGGVGSNCDIIDDEFDVTDIELHCIEEIDEGQKKVLKDQMKKSMKVTNALVKLTTSKETYPGCRRRNYQVLCYMPEVLLRLLNKNGTTETADDVLKWLLEECLRQHESIGGVALKCAGSFIDWLMQKGSQTVISTGVADLLCRVLMEFSSAEKSSEIRSIVAHILLTSSYMLTSASFLSALNVCTLWTVAMTLLDDDDLQIRNTTAGLALKLVPKVNMPVIAHWARELLVKEFTNTMLELDLILCVTTLLAWSLSELEEDNSFEDSEDRVFDKGEMNVFAERGVLTELACKHLEDLLEAMPGIMDTRLEDKVKYWLYKQCWPSGPEENLELEGISSLREFVKLAADKVQSEKKYDKVSHFLIPDQKSIFVATYKMMCVLQVVSRV